MKRLSPAARRRPHRLIQSVSRGRLGVVSALAAGVLLTATACASGGDSNVAAAASSVESGLTRIYGSHVSESMIECVVDRLKRLPWDDGAEQVEAAFAYDGGAFGVSVGCDLPGRSDGRAPGVIGQAVSDQLELMRAGQ